jgi:NAD(P)H-hydrate repair Nnr-like enzyme with NAD(P)H-hydrate dehydratase domain
MDRTYWHRQTPDKPLFPDLLWSRPEHKAQAGKLLIIGGSSHGFAAPAEAFAEAEKAGIGHARVLLPDSLQKTIGRAFTAGEYAPSTPSGSFSQQALAELLEFSQWADTVLLAGDFGHNSETAILLEKFTQDYQGRLILAQDAIDYFTAGAAAIHDRGDTLLAAEFSQLQKMAQSTHFPQAFTSNMDFLKMVENLHDFTEEHAAGIIVSHAKNTYVAIQGQVSTTKAEESPDTIHIAAHAAVWWLQNPTKIFEAITTSIIQPGQ